MVKKPKPETLPVVEKPKPETIPVVEKPKPETLPLVTKPPLSLPEYLERRILAKIFAETEKVRIDYEGKRAFFEKYRDTSFVGVTKVLTLSRYLAYKMEEDFAKDFSREAERRMFSQEKITGISGLIPEIEIPKVPLIGESKINIAGEDRITLGGRQTRVTGGTQTSRTTPLFPELKMEQALQLNLEGTIGERTKVTIDHNSQRELEAKNKVKLEYTGGEDEVIKKLELGETRLSIPGTAFTGDIPTGKGLFGISGYGALGGINLHLIASREQSQPQTREFRGRNPVYTDTFYDNEFAKERFFLLDTLPITELKEIYLYYDDNQPYGTGKIRCLATIKPESPEDTLPNPDFPGDRKISSFILLKPNEDYKIHRFLEGSIFLEVMRDVKEGRLGVSYITEKNETIGGYQYYQDSLLVIKLLKAHRYDRRSKTWPLTMRNIYTLAARNVQLANVRIFRDEPDVDRETDENGKTFLQLTGLDPDGDGKVGYPQFIPSLGYLIFPYPEPFAKTSLTIPDTIIYRKDALLPGEGKLYYIVAEYTASSQVISIGLDVERETEKVYVQGVEQIRGEDYKIDYEKGEITFLKPLPPDADIKITYEYLPLFMAVSRSIFGARAEGRLTESGKFGTSIFYRNEITPQEKPSLGSEPFQRMIWESDLTYTYKSENLTNILDGLPLVRAQTPTELSLSGEVAASLPNPNTFGVAYVDDFEQMVISEKVDLQAINWQYASVPIGKDTANFAKKRLFWFNPAQRIRKDSIFGPRVKEEREERVDYMKIIFEPDNTVSWAGMMCAIRGSVDIRNLENIEGIFRTRQNSGKIYVTLATTVEEDAPRRNYEGKIVGYNNFFDTEDRNQNAQLDDQLGEDSGLDTVLGKDGAGVSGDDGNDDYNVNTNPSGTEGNKILDSEDVDGNGFSPRGDNNYYEYEIDLQDTTYFTNLINNWRVFRIPLSKWQKKEGTPLNQEIRIVRLWFSSFSQPETIDFYSLEITGSKWQGVKIEGPPPERGGDNEGMGPPSSGPNFGPDTIPDLLVKIYQISIENDTSYNSPFELKYDPFGKREKEASLALTFKNLPGKGKIVIPQTFFTKEDWRDYKRLKIYVHKEPSLDPIFFLRMGQDSSNYYYFRSYISQGRQIPGTDGNWYEFEIDLDTLRNIRRLQVIREDYGYKGTPTLSEVREIALGIENPTTERISGTIWFNDIRLTQPYVSPGFGYQTALRFSLSDVANFSLSLSYLDPNFIRLSEGGGVKTGDYRYSQAYSAGISLDRFLPATWQLFLPISYQRTQSSIVPKFHPLAPDLRINLNQPEAESSKGKGFSESWSGTLRKGKSGNKILNYTLDALSFSYQRGREKSWQRLSTDTSYRSNFGINYGISPNLFFTLGENEIYYFPQNISFGVGYSSSRSLRATKTQDTAQYHIIKDSSRVARLSLSTGFTPIENLTFDYDANEGRDFYAIPEDKGKRSRLGEETDKDRHFGASYSFELGEILSPQLEYDGGYSESRMRQRDTLLKRRTFSNEAEYRIDTDLNLPSLLAKLKGEEEEEKGSRSQKGFLQDLLKRLGGLAEIIEPFDISYTISRASEFPTAYSSPPLLYQLGFIDRYREDTLLREPLTRETDNRFSTSSRLKLGNIGISYSYDYAVEKGVTSGIGNAAYSLTWPSFNITISRIERYLKKWATSSNLSLGFSRNTDRSGSLAPDGKLLIRGSRLGKRNSFSPLIGWQTTWQKRINTNLSINYATSSDEINLTGPPQNQTSRTVTKDKGIDFSISHAFSAPKGIKLPFLPKIKLTQELSLSWDIRYAKSENTRIEGGQRIPIGANENISTRLSSSYRISATVESGFNTGYTSYRDLQRRLHSQSIDLNIWVLFRF